MTMQDYNYYYIQELLLLLLIAITTATSIPWSPPHFVLVTVPLGSSRINLKLAITTVIDLVGVITSSFTLVNFQQRDFVFFGILRTVFS